MNKKTHTYTQYTRRDFLKTTLYIEDIVPKSVFYLLVYILKEEQTVWKAKKCFVSSTPQAIITQKNLMDLAQRWLTHYTKIILIGMF